MSFQKSPELLNNPKFILKACKNDINAFKYASTQLRKDFNFIEKLFYLNQELAIEYLPKTTNFSYNMVNSIIYSRFPIQNLPNDFFINNNTLVNDLLKERGRYMEFLPEIIKKNRIYATIAIKSEPLSFEFIDKSLQKDEKLILFAVKKDERVLQFISPEFLDDKFFMMECMKKNGRSFQYASPRLQIDYDIILEASRKHEESLVHLHHDIKSFDYFWMHLVSNTQNETVLYYADPKLLKDRDFMSKMVEIKGNCLRYASEEIKNDRTIALNAIRNDHSFYNGDEIYFAFSFASESLRNDKEILTKAVKKNISSLWMTGDNLRIDKEVEWIARKYFQFIRNVPTCDVEFKFN